MAMEDCTINSRSLTSAEPVMGTARSEDYLRRLLVERPYIRSALDNPGGSIILQAHNTVEQQFVSTVCGNDTHLDLLEVEDILRSLPRSQALALLAWSSGVDKETEDALATVKPAAMRKRRSRAIQSLVKAMDEPARGGGEPST